MFGQLNMYTSGLQNTSKHTTLSTHLNNCKYCVSLAMLLQNPARHYKSPFKWTSRIICILHTEWSYQDINSILDRSLQLAEVKLFVKILYLQGPVPPHGRRIQDLWASVHFRNFRDFPVKINRDRQTEHTRKSEDKL